jgi:hypothetical protein
MMRVVHLNKQKPVASTDFAACLQQARFSEADGDIDTAIVNYTCCIKLRSTYEPAYNRLMILHRKNKAYKKELEVINTGIKAFENLYSKSVKKAMTKTAVQLSRSLLKSTGLVDKKGKELFEQPPLPRWRQRAAIVKKRLNK